MNNVITNPSRIESENISKFLDQLAEQTTDPNIKNSLIQHSANLKATSSAGLATKTYAFNSKVPRNNGSMTGKPKNFKSGSVPNGKNFKSGSTSTTGTSRMTSTNQVNQSKTPSTGSVNTSQQVQSNPSVISTNQPKNPSTGSVNTSQQVQSNQQTQTTSPAPQSEVQQSEAPKQSNIKGAVMDKVANNTFLENNYMGMDIAKLANSKARTNSFQSDMINDTFDQYAKSENPKNYESESDLDNAKNYNKQLVNDLENDANVAESNGGMDYIKNRLNEYYDRTNKNLVKNNKLNRMSDDYFANQWKTLSNKMINLNNIRYFSEQSQDYIIRMYADSLTEEEMQDAIKRKNRKKKFLNVLKTLGGIGLAGAALYGGSKWYQNGGKDYLSKVGDSASDFITKTGDAAIESGKDIGNATTDEANRVADEVAKWRLNKSDSPIKLDGSETLLTEPGTKVNPEELRDQMRIDELNKRIDKIDSQMDELNRAEQRLIGIWGSQEELDKIAQEKSKLTAERYNLTAELHELAKTI